MADGRKSWVRKRLGLPWRVSLTARILAVNIIALGLLAGSLFYIDSYRKELIDERFRLAEAEAEIAAIAIKNAQPTVLPDLLTRIGLEQSMRLRVYDANGTLISDSFELAEPTYEFIDPDSEPWYQDAARMLDRWMDFLLEAPPIPDYPETSDGNASQWPEIGQARSTGSTVIVQRAAPDRTPVITAATPIENTGTVLLTTRNATDITQNVRDARQTLAIIVGGALIVSILLSLFLARTIVQPLRELVRAAIRVRLGRDREVVVPRLPDRRDEIGMLARSVSDMTAALRQRIDAVESFAADVSHELKNPLTSLRSALESLDRVNDPALREQLLNIAKQDVARVDWLVTEIADASRIDAELSRTTFEPVDMLKLVLALVAERDSRGVNGDCKVVVSQSGEPGLRVAVDSSRIERALHNLIDNAVSFSPQHGKVEIELARNGRKVTISVSDQGPGVPPEVRDKIFERFHSLRPDEEDPGLHSGLGLAIASTIVEAHFGTLRVDDRADGSGGARFVITLPALDHEP